MKLLFLCLVVSVALSACNQDNKKISKESVVGLPKGDSAFLALKDSAQANISQFIDSLKRHPLDEDNYIFVVKSDFVENDTHEHMWSKVYMLKDDHFKGVLIDSPYSVKHIKIDEKVKVSLKDVEDWIIYDNLHNRKISGYSSEYLRSKMK